MSIIITITSNITVLVSHSVICFGYFMPMSHGVNKKAPPIVSPHPSPLPGFVQVCLLFYNKNFLNLLSLWLDYCKKQCIFKLKQIFSSNLFLVGFDFAVAFSVSEETKFEVDSASIILSYLRHFWKVNKELYRYC